MLSNVAFNKEEMCGLAFILLGACLVLVGLIKCFGQNIEYNDYSFEKEIKNTRSISVKKTKANIDKLISSKIPPKDIVYRYGNKIIDITEFEKLTQQSSPPKDYRKSSPGPSAQLPQVS